jgi:hypothetical protein
VATAGMDERFAAIFLTDRSGFGGREKPPRKRLILLAATVGVSRLPHRLPHFPGPRESGGLTL